MGAPKNRLRGGLSHEAAFAAGTDFFREVGDTAAACRTRLCLEPNPAAYGADFLLNAAETAALVEAVNSPGIALNFDMGEQALNNADAAANVLLFASLIGHFHVSEPMLEPFDPARSAHAKSASALRAAGFTGAVSLEMKPPAGGLPALRAAIAALKTAYQL